MDGLLVGGFQFYSNFDSANLAKVELVPPNESVVTPASNTGKSVVPEIPDVEFNLWTKPDCCGTEYENGNRTWFYFGMRARAPALLVKLNMVDINKQTKMYSQGMAPVYRIIPCKPHWERVRDRPSYTNIDNVFTLSFKFKTPDINNIVYFAFTYPFSYMDLQSFLSTAETKYLNSVPHCKDDIYYHREVVCYSLENRRVELITISSYHNISSERETRLKNLFPDENCLRPFRFLEKKVVFISARVHPGETPSSFVFNGFMNLLLNREDPVAVILRKHYVFKLIPFLNPDGVARGHYRTDTRGVNLNRVYLKPIFLLHPSIYAARALIRYYHHGFEKPDDELENAQSEEKLPSLSNSSSNSDNKLTKQVSHMTLEENEKNKNKNAGGTVWCSKCKTSIDKLEGTMPGISTLIPTFDHNNTLCTGKDFCRNCGHAIEDGHKTGDTKEGHFVSGDSNINQSGLFLYVDMHGHASKKGIFMYGNHFQDLDENVDCMLLPKVMSLNNHNFHFTACNFTEKNMYLRDKRDGMSREGSGRVAVLKMTGLIRSYTLECNYNSGRLVNNLPPTIKETNNKGIHAGTVPPKYNPQVFEEVGKALGQSILDLTGLNPFTRLTNSEFHSLNGLREWLRLYSCNELGETGTPTKLKHKQASKFRSQGKAVRAVVLKTRSTSAKTPQKKMATKVARSTSIPIDRKENVGYHTESLIPQPSCSQSGSTNFIASCIRAGLQHGKSMNVKSRYKKDITAKKNIPPPPAEKAVRSYSNIHRNSANASQRPKLKVDMKMKNANKEGGTKDAATQDDSELDRIKLHEICYVKDAEGGKKVIAKYKNIISDTRIQEDNLIVSWDSPTAPAQVFSQKCLLPKGYSEPGPSKQSAFRVHNFAKSSSFGKNKRNKRTLRRLTGATESCSKIDKLKKRKKLQNKLS